MSRFADAHSQARLEQLEAARGRPLNSPGWGLLQCVKSGELRSRDGEEVTRVTAGTTRCAVNYWAAQEWPEFFMPIDKRDTRTRDAHRRNLERARQELERTPTRAPASRPHTKGVLSRKVLPPAPPWRLPRPATPTRVLP